MHFYNASKKSESNHKKCLVSRLLSILYFSIAMIDMMIRGMVISECIRLLVEMFLI